MRTRAHACAPGCEAAYESSAYSRLLQTADGVKKWHLSSSIISGPRSRIRSLTPVAESVNWTTRTSIAFADRRTHIRFSFADVGPPALACARTTSHGARRSRARQPLVFRGTVLGHPGLSHVRAVISLCRSFLNRSGQSCRRPSLPRPKARTSPCVRLMAPQDSRFKDRRSRWPALQVPRECRTALRRIPRRGDP